MLFNSIEFTVFFPVVFVLYWFVFNKSVKIQNWLLLLSSYFFYGSWDYRFLFLLIFSTSLDFASGLMMANARDQVQRRFWFWLSIAANLGFLGFFKYYNFFVDSFAGLIESLGFQANIWTLQVILPVGISFYTFHGMSYVIDVYHRRIEATPNFVQYAVFVSYFPLLVAGPIERAPHLLPQISTARSFNFANATSGMRQILWGLFKKIVIADNCAVHVNSIFDNYQDHSGSTLAMGAFLFAFQIYCDFSGYSDIALGTSRLLGIELLRNFAFPYFSRDIAEFWRRWHISLTTWLRDYLYIPLGGSQGNTLMKIRNTFTIFLVSGFWHGANWTLILWGFVNACYFLPLQLLGKNRIHTDQVAEGRMLPSVKEVVQIGLTFSLTLIAWVFFRSRNVGEAFAYLGIVFGKSLWNFPDVVPLTTLVLLAALLVIEWMGRNQQYALETISSRIPKLPRWGFYYTLIFLIIHFSGKQQEFIYFQF